MKQFIKNNFTTIVLVIALLSFFKVVEMEENYHLSKKKLGQLKTLQ